LVEPDEPEKPTSKEQAPEKDFLRHLSRGAIEDNRGVVDIGEKHHM
jgi:hypothetical protein